MAQDTPVACDYLLKPGYIFIHQGQTVVRTVLGSAVAVTLWDRRLGRGGIIHFQYPRTDNRQEATARFGNVALLALINMLVTEGSRVQDLEAHIIGGAHPPEKATEDLGGKNVAIARQILAKKQITVVSEDIGGHMGRKVLFNLATNEMVVIKVEQLRASDWYPYEDHR